MSKNAPLPGFESALAELERAPSFFDERGEVSSALRTAVDRYTGARTGRDERRADVACALRMLGSSDREIAAAVKCDVRTIPHLLATAEQSGRIPALKERLSRLSGEVAEDAALLLKRLLARGLDGEVDADLAAMIKATGIPFGIAVEKHQLLTGGATERIEQIAGAAREEEEAWFARIKQARAEVIEVPSDSASIGNDTVCGQFEPPAKARHGGDTVASADPVPAVDLEQPAAGAGQGAGGVASTAPAAEVRLVQVD
jgi:hypothetical protein